MKYVPVQQIKTLSKSSAEVKKESKGFPLDSLRLFQAPMKERFCPIKLWIYK